MKSLVLTLLCLAAVSGCALSDATGPVRVCLPDSGFCHFEERK